MGLLDGKAAVVTGGGQGIGRGHCLHLARNGASVVVNDVDAERAKEVAAEIAREGGRAVTSGADIGQRAGCEELVRQCVKELGAIDLLVNNAGIARDRTLLKMSDDEF